MAALSISGFYAEKFYFAGFPPREKINRKNFYNKILQSKETIVLFERPYALNKIIEDLQNIKKRLSISFNLGMPNEKTFRGYFEDISPKITNIKKQPFVVVIEGKNER
jgi:16S rRNA (cytidine1402-2'-O)-methyltransferase